MLSIFKYNPGETNNKFVRLLLNNFYRVISHRRVQKESNELLCTVWSLVMVRDQLTTQGIKRINVFSVFFVSIDNDKETAGEFSRTWGKFNFQCQCTGEEDFRRYVLGNFE